jgi:hypothetical protein
LSAGWAWCSPSSFFSVGATGVSVGSTRLPLGALAA